MSSFVIGIDISKYKHDCCIIDAQTLEVISRFTFSNDKEGFNRFLCVYRSLNSESIKTGFESTSHYSLNLKLFLEQSDITFMEFNPVLVREYIKSLSLRKTKNDSIDSEHIAKWLVNVEYKPFQKGFYHAYSLKSLTRLRDTLVKDRSRYLIRLTDVMDHVFPEFKPFFNNRFSHTALYILEKYPNADKISHMNKLSFEKLNSISRGRFSMQKFLQLKQLARDTVGQTNPIFEAELKSLLALYHAVDEQIKETEKLIINLIEDIHPHYLSIPGIGPLSAAVIYAEYGGDLSRFSSPSKMVAFAGLDAAYYQSGIGEQTGRMVKRGSGALRYALMNCAGLIISSDFTFAEYYRKKRDEGKPYRVALSHVAKKLIRVIYTLEKKGLDFDADMIR